MQGSNDNDASKQCNKGFCCEYTVDITLMVTPLSNMQFSIAALYVHTEN